MDIVFDSKKIKKIANNQAELQKAHGRLAKAIRRRLDELADADSLEVLKCLPQARCHELKGNRQGQLAVRLDKNFRLIFTPPNQPIPRKEDGGLDWSCVTAVKILKLAEDYHGD